MAALPAGRVVASGRPVTVLVVDDAPVVRGAYREAFSRVPGLQVVGAAADPYEARDLLLAHDPDIMVLDLEMPRLDGLTFLTRLMEHRPARAVVVSSLTSERNRLAFACLEAGALDVFGKPAPGEAPGAFLAALAQRLLVLGRTPMPTVRGAAASPSVPAPAVATLTRHLIAIGGSTGGTEALATILGALPTDLPGIVAALHLPGGFPELYAERLGQRCRRTVRVAATGMAVTAGECLIAPANRHTLVMRRDGAYLVEVRDGPAVAGHKPSVDVLLRSVARCAGGDAVGVLLTGMGKDGAGGLTDLHRAGAATIAQDEATSVVWGMPGEAVRLGGAGQVLPLPGIAAGILGAVTAKRA